VQDEVRLRLGTSCIFCNGESVEVTSRNAALIDARCLHFGREWQTSGQVLVREVDETGTSLRRYVALTHAAITCWYRVTDRDVQFNHISLGFDPDEVSPIAISKLQQKMWKRLKWEKFGATLWGHHVLRWDMESSRRRHPGVRWT